LQFLTKNYSEISMQVSFGNRKIAATQSLKFLGLTIDTSLTCKYHIGELTSRLNKACYAIRSVKPFMSLTFTQLYLMELYFGGIHPIVKKYIKFRKK